VLEEKQHLFAGKTPLQQIGNRNEESIFQRMPGVLQALEYEPQSLDIQDIYTLALNELPPNYVLETAIVLKELVDEQTIQMTIREAAEQVCSNPNYG